MQTLLLALSSLLPSTPPRALFLLNRRRRIFSSFFFPDRIMSAASVAAPMTTAYIQSPTRFASTAEAAAAARARQVSQQQGPAPASFYGGATTQFEGSIPRVKDHQPNPIVLTAKNPYALQQQSITPTARVRTPQRQQEQETQRLPSVRASPSSRFEQSRAPRINRNSRTSASFPLAVTAQQKADTAARKLAERLDWEEEQERLAENDQAQAEYEAAIRDEARTQSDVRQSTGSMTNSATAKLAQAALHQKQLKDCKIPFRDRVVPPTPDYPEDPLTAHASEHTGIYPGPLHRGPPERSPFTLDSEAAAPEGSSERLEQRRRTNPLLDPLYQSKSDAAGLGYGKTHRNHYRYISHWTSTETNAATAASAVAGQQGLSGYRSKDNRGYRPDVRSLGWGSPHGTYNTYVSVRRVEDVLKDYPNREACERFLNKK